MDIEKFISEFKDIVPYKFNLKVGGKRADAIKTDKELVTSRNRKGKAYPYYKNTVVGTETSYFPLDSLDVPIELSIACDYPHFVRWEKSSISTKKETTSFEARILASNLLKQLGYLSLKLTPAGDITHKFCTFYSPDGMHEIMQSITYEFDEKTKKVTPLEQLSFILYNLSTGLEEKVVFYKQGPTLKGLTISKEPLRNHAFDSIVWSDERFDAKGEFFSKYTNTEGVESASPLACDMTNYIINKDFVATKNRIKELESLLECEGLPGFYHDYEKIRMEIESLQDPASDIFSGFYGTYIGNTVIKKDGKVYLVIETAEEEYHYYTPVDITNTNAFDIDFYHERSEDSSYYNAIINADKKPLFRTTIEEGNEVLAPLDQNETEKERAAYEAYRMHYPESLSMLESKKISTLSLTKISEKLSCTK